MHVFTHYPYSYRSVKTKIYSEKSLDFSLKYCIFTKQ